MRKEEKTSTLPHSFTGCKYSFNILLNEGVKAFLKITHLNAIELSYVLKNIWGIFSA
jgi:hypothetical protein